MRESREQASDERPGIFISFEGGEGAGKSTHIRFLAETLEDRGFEVLCVREPGGTVIGEKLRSIVLDTAHTEMTDEAELLIYEAARAQIVSEVIRPALEKGSVVLCDRFYDSTVAYQVYGRGLDQEFVEQANAFACQGIHPDRTILLDCGDSAQTGLKRATHHADADRLESAGEKFHTVVNNAFLEIARENPERIRTVISSDLKSNTSRAIFNALGDIFPWMIKPGVLPDDFFDRLNEKKATSGNHG